MSDIRGNLTAKGGVRNVPGGVPVFRNRSGRASTAPRGAFYPPPPPRLMIALWPLALAALPLCAQPAAANTVDARRLHRNARETGRKSMGWFMLRRSRSLAGSQGRRFPRKGGGGPSRVPARAVLLLLVMVAALAPRAFAQTTPNPGDKWSSPGPGAGNWAQLGVTPTSLVGKLMLQQSFTIARSGGAGLNWRHAGISACPWRRVAPPFPSTGCETLKSEGASAGSGASETLSNFEPTQAMIDNGGAVFRVTWDTFAVEISCLYPVGFSCTASEGGAGPYARLDFGERRRCDGDGDAGPDVERRDDDHGVGGGGGPGGVG